MNEWKTRELGAEPLALAALNTSPDAPGAGAFLSRAPIAGQEGWLLFTPAAQPVLVNGEPVFLGVRALYDRDELRLPGAAPMYFSTEHRVAIEPFTGLAEGRCPRCTRVIDLLSPAVRCASCKTWYHSTEARPCFSYGESPICVVCGADAVLSAEYSWSPEKS